jgi:hypothetical protein
MKTLHTNCDSVSQLYHMFTSKVTYQEEFFVLSYWSLCWALSLISKSRKTSHFWFTLSDVSLHPWVLFTMLEYIKIGNLEFALSNFWLLSNKRKDTWYSDKGHWIVPPWWWPFVCSASCDYRLCVWPCLHANAKCRAGRRDTMPLLPSAPSYKHKSQCTVPNLVSYSVKLSYPNSSLLLHCLHRMQKLHSQRIV